MRSSAYLFSLLKACWAGHHADSGRTALLVAAMFVQNFIFFLVWVVFFSTITEIRGWRLEDLGLLFGVLAAATGLTLFFCDGVRTLPFVVRDGGLDALITRPRHPLPALLLSRSSADGMGDILSAPVYLFAFGGASLHSLPLLIALSLLAATIFLSALIIFYSLIFWVPRGGRFADQLFEILVISASIPQQGQSFGAKLIIFSIIPAGFMSLTPVFLLRHFDVWTFCALLLATAVYAVLAVLVFNAGLKRHVSCPAE